MGLGLGWTKVKTGLQVRTVRARGRVGTMVG